MKNKELLLLKFGFWKRLMLNITKPSWTLVVSNFVPSNQLYFLQYEGWKLKWVFKYLKRKLFMKLALQEALIVDSIPREARRILWINFSAPSLGDSIMDLSGRVLLTGFNVDLLTDSKNYSLYENDMVFKTVFNNVEDAKGSHLSSPYDLIILDAFSPKIVNAKKRIAPMTYFVGMWEYLNGFEVHRTIYSFARIQWLLDRQTFITKPVLPSLAVSELVKIERNSVKPIVVIVVGAEWKYRHYDNWVTIVSQLVSDYEILLLGSINGLKDASAILSEFPECINYVGNRTLSETVSIISQAKVVFAADGGLWHVACALGKPSVVLFAAMPLFNESGVRVNRDTADMLCEVVYDDNQVSDIDPQKIMKAFERLIDRI